jgi:hypothetical protein
VLQGSHHVEYAKRTAAGEVVVAQLTVKLADLVSRKSSMTSAQHEAAANQALDSIAASMGLLEAETRSNALPIERFRTMSPSQEPFPLWARLRMAEHGVAAGNMSNPEQRIVQGPLAQDQHGDSARTTAGGGNSSR